jgi:RNA polymerase sigma-70 factor (ECF subfamily)
VRAEWIDAGRNCPISLPVQAMSEDLFPERELVESARNGDLAAYEELHHKYVGKVYGLCLRMVSDPTRAEELTQDAFVKAWQKLSAFKGKSSFYTWLHRISVNQCLGHLRSKKLWSDRIKAGDAEILERQAEPAQPDPTKVLDLESAIASLPVSGRAVFLLYDVEGYKHREIAELLGIATGTSKALLHRARLSLRKALQR